MRGLTRGLASAQIACDEASPRRQRDGAFWEPEVEGASSRRRLTPSRGNHRRPQDQPVGRLRRPSGGWRGPVGRPAVADREAPRSEDDDLVGSQPIAIRSPPTSEGTRDNQRMADVFLSYTMRDAQVAQRLAHALRQAGISVFWDRDSTAPGETIHDALAKALSEARAFVFLHPVEVGSSGFLQLETDAALSRSKSGGLLVLPVLLPGREPTGDIGTFRYIRLKSSEDLGPVVEVVAKALDSKGVPASTPGRYMSFLSALLRTDLAQAPQAASLVLDEISSTAEGRPEDLEVLRAALDWGEHNLRPDHPAVRSSRYQLSHLLQLVGRYEESAALSGDVLASSDNPFDRLSAGINLGNALAALGDLGAAEGRYREVLFLADQLGNRSAEGAAFVALASVALRRGDLELARSQFQKAVDVTSQTGDTSARVSALVGLSNVQNASGDHGSALSSATEALRLGQSTLGRDDALTVQAADAVHEAEANQ